MSISSHRRPVRPLHKRHDRHPRRPRAAFDPVHLRRLGKLSAISATAAWFGSIGLPVPTVTTVVVGLGRTCGRPRHPRRLPNPYCGHRRARCSRWPQLRSRISTSPTRCRCWRCRRTSPSPAASCCSPRSAPAPFRWTPAAPERCDCENEKARSDPGLFVFMSGGRVEATSRSSFRPDSRRQLPEPADGALARTGLRAPLE